MDFSGKNNSFYGKKHTEEAKRKIGLSKIGNSDVYQFGDDIIKLYQRGLSSYKIAEKFGVHRCFITSFLKKKKIKLRRGGGYKGQKAWNKGKKCPQTSSERNGNWKGGITPLNQRIRHCLKYKQWIETIFKRDDWICQICEKRGGNLEADHSPKKFSVILADNKITTLKEAENCKELWDLKNGRTICLKCHNRTKQVRSRFKKFGIT